MDHVIYYTWLPRFTPKYSFTILFENKYAIIHLIIYSFRLKRLCALFKLTLRGIPMTNDCAETYSFVKSLFITIPELDIDNKLSALSAHRDCQATSGDNCLFGATNWRNDHKGRS